MSNPNCEDCGVEINPPDSAAVDEYRANFPDAQNEETILLCDKCYERFMALLSITK